MLIFNQHEYVLDVLEETILLGYKPQLSFIDNKSIFLRLYSLDYVCERISSSCWEAHLFDDHLYGYLLCIGLLSLFIGMLLYAFLPKSRMIFCMAYYINATITFASKRTSTLVTLVIMVIKTLPLTFVPFCLWVTIKGIWSLGGAKNKESLLSPISKLSIELWLMLPPKFYGYVPSMNLGLSYKKLCRCTMIIKPLFSLWIYPPSWVH